MHIIENLIFHCSDSTWGNTDVIRNWHVNGNDWREIGYNGVILNGKISSTLPKDMSLDGKLEIGRGLDFSEYVESDERAAHTLSYNHNSLGFCLIGEDKFTENQFWTAINIARVFKNINKNIKIFGHYEMSTARGKSCPNFNMNAFRQIIHACIYDYNAILVLLKDSLT